MKSLSPCSINIKSQLKTAERIEIKMLEISQYDKKFPSMMTEKISRFNLEPTPIKQYKCNCYIKETYFGFLILKVFCT